MMAHQAARAEAVTQSRAQVDGTPDRSKAIDALRGFALLGIVAVNAQFFAAPLTSAPIFKSPLDILAYWFLSAFAMGKFFLIFSFLFGFGFATILDRAQASGKPVRGRFFRRLLALFLFGLLHATFLFSGDILMLYALLGIVLWLCRSWSNRALLFATAVAYVIAIGCQVMLLQFTSEDLVPAAIEPGRGYLGGFVEGARQRISDWPIVLPFILLFNGPAAFAMFLTGLAAGRLKLVPPTEELLVRLAPGASIALLVAATATGSAGALLLPGSGFSSSLITSGAILDAIFAPVLSFSMAIGVLFWATKAKDSGLVRWLAVTGSSSLSGYIVHSVILGAIFNGWGVGLYGSLRPASVLAVSLATFVTIVAALNIWKKWFRYGPDEWLLRSIVDLEWKPLRNPA
jgi:uncharacterized protein